MIELLRTNSGNRNFKELVNDLDTELAIVDGEEHAFYSQYNSIHTLNYVLIAMDESKAIGCGAMKEIEPKVFEIKRMYVESDSRGKGIGGKILKALEMWAMELNIEKCVLETGKKQQEAIALYNRSGYKLTPNYGQYKDIANSICFEKLL